MIAIKSAIVIQYAPTSDLKFDVFDNTIGTNAKGTVLCARAVFKVMSTQEPLTHEGRHG